jgi:hypothetical protein
MKLKQSLLLIGVIVIGVFLLLSLPDVHKNNQNNSVIKNTLVQPGKEESSTNTKSKLDTKVDTQGAVTITITPLLLSSKDAEWKFDVGVNTHSIELDQDMTKVAVLVDSQGKEYRPLRWEGAGPGGHHREGLLVWKSIVPTPKSVMLKIENIEAPVRSFVWDIIN